LQNNYRNCQTNKTTKIEVARPTKLDENFERPTVFERAFTTNMRGNLKIMISNKLSTTAPQIEKKSNT